MEVMLNVWAVRSGMASESFIFNTAAIWGEAYCNFILQSEFSCHGNLLYTSWDYASV